MSKERTREAFPIEYLVTILKSQPNIDLKWLKVAESPFINYIDKIEPTAFLKMISDIFPHARVGDYPRKLPLTAEIPLATQSGLIEVANDYISQRQAKGFDIPSSHQTQIRLGIALFRQLFKLCIVQPDYREQKFTFQINGSKAFGHEFAMYPDIFSTFEYLNKSPTYTVIGISFINLKLTFEPIESIYYGKYTQVLIQDIAFKKYISRSYDIYSNKLRKVSIV